MRFTWMGHLEQVGIVEQILASKNCMMYAIDRDPDVARFANALSEEFPGKVTFIKGNFSDMERLLLQHGIQKSAWDHIGFRCIINAA